MALSRQRVWRFAPFSPEACVFLEGLTSAFEMDPNLACVQLPREDPPQSRRAIGRQVACHPIDPFYPCGGAVERWAATQEQSLFASFSGAFFIRPPLGSCAEECMAHQAFTQDSFALWQAWRLDRLLSAGLGESPTPRDATPSPPSRSL